MRRFIACLLVAALMMACSMTARPPNAQPAPTQPPSITRAPETINLRIGITDGQQPIKGTIRLYWPDTGGELTVGPTSEFVFPIPADSSAISVTVTALGFLPWSQLMTPTRSSSLTVRLVK